MMWIILPLLKGVPGLLESLKQISIIDPIPSKYSLRLGHVWSITELMIA